MLNNLVMFVWVVVFDIEIEYLFVWLDVKLMLFVIVCVIILFLLFVIIVSVLNYVLCLRFKFFDFKLVVKMFVKWWICLVIVLRFCGLW